MEQPSVATRLIASAVAEATGQERRHDPVLPGTGGPAGNAALTAWTGLVLLTLSVAELLTLVNVRGLISWHVAIGALLVPPAVLKTATTGWRIVRYYGGDAPYQQAGPPPLALRLLGPLVVASTLGLLASGILLVLVGEENARQSLFSVLGFGVGWLTVHQGFFLVWAGATGLHLLGRIVPALRLTLGPRFGGDATARVPGALARAASVVAVGVVAVALAVVLVQTEGSWGHDDRPFGHGQDGIASR
jgi:hypothetical protein